MATYTVFTNTSDQEFTSYDIIINSASYTSLGIAVADLKSVAIGNTVTSIDTEAFKDAINLNTFTFEAGSTLDSIGERAFQGTSILTSFTIPQGLTSIENFAFQHSGITSITIPNSVITMGAAFYAAESLTTFTFEDNSLLETIETYAFRTSGITSIEIPNSIITIGDDAFSYTSALSEVTFETDSLLETIGINAFRSSGFTSISRTSNHYWN